MVDLIADGATNRESLVKRLDEYENQKKQIENNISQIGFKINELSSKLISQDAVMANLKFFNEVFGQLPGNKKKELLRLLIKKIVLEEVNGKVNGNGNGNTKKGKIKMSLWDLPPIDSSTLDSAGFAESKLWLPKLVSQSIILWDGLLVEMQKVIKGHTTISLLPLVMIDINDAPIYASGSMG